MCVGETCKILGEKQYNSILSRQTEDWEIARACVVTAHSTYITLQISHKHGAGLFYYDNDMLIGLRTMCRPLHTDEIF